MALSDNVASAYTQSYNLALTAINQLSSIATASMSYTGNPATLGNGLHSLSTQKLDSQSASLLPSAYVDPEALVIAQALALVPYVNSDLSGVVVDFTGLPTAVDLSSFTTPTWSEAYWTNLKTSLNDYITTILNSASIDSVILDLSDMTDRNKIALYAQDLERKQQALRDVYSAASSSTGAKGFLYPNILTIALKLKGQQDYQFDLSQTSRDLTKFIFEWAKTNYQFTLDKGVSSHNADTEWNARYADALVKVYDATLGGIINKNKLELEFAMGVVESKVKEYGALINGILKKYTDVSEVKMKTQTTQAEIQNKYYTLLCEIAKTQNTVFEMQDKIVLQKYASDIQQITGLGTLQVKASSESAVARINAASGAVQGASSLANAASQSAISIQQIV